MKVTITRQLNPPTAHARFRSELSRLFPDYEVIDANS